MQDELSIEKSRVAILVEERNELLRKVFELEEQVRRLTQRALDGAECVWENHTDNDGWRCNVCGLLSPHRKHEGGRTLLALDVCPSCAGKGTYQIGVFSETCSACHGTGKRQ